MIVQAFGSSLHLITQLDHAALAARIVAGWRAGGLDGRVNRDAIMLAVREHDNGWREPDAHPILDPHTGRVLDFMTVPGTVRRAIWPRGVARLADEPWAAALVAQHALHIYRRYRADAEWSAFFDQMERARERHRSTLPSRSLEDLLSDYFFVRMGDLVSLTFCNRWTDVQEESGYAIRLEGARVRIAPDPFEGATVPIEVIARELPNQSFNSEVEAADAFAAARVVTLAGSVSG